MRIVVCDDHTLFVEGIKAILRNHPSLEIVGEARDGRQAVELVKEFRPDVLLMDVSMPDMNGFDATRRVHEFDSSVKVLILTMHDEEELVARCLEAGASGYILKDANEIEVVRAIQAVSGGDAIFSATIAQRLIDFFATPHPAQALLPFPDLTEREREILMLITQGRSNAEIAQSLVISMKTVRNYISSIFSKLQVADRSQAIIRAREAGLG